MDELERYAADSLALLASCIRLYQAGQRAFYRVAAVQLRLLLCDTTRVHGKIVDISLARRLWPELKLHPAVQQGKDVFFDRSQAPIPLARWLDQAFQPPEGQPMSLRQAIRLVCDRDGGAHVDPPSEPLPDLGAPILSIAEYVAMELVRLRS